MATTDSPPPKKTVNLRLPEDLYLELKAFADRTERSANAAAVYAIRTFLASEQQDHPDTTHLR